MTYPRGWSVRPAMSAGTCAIAAVILTVCLAIGRPLSAQESSVAKVGAAPLQESLGGALIGSVVDATTSAPLAGSTVVLRLVESEHVAGAKEAASLPDISRQVVTSDDGVYRFDELPAGSYRLRVQRMGYHPATLTVKLPGQTGSRVSVGLAVAPVRLEAIAVHGEPEIAFAVAPAGSEAATDTAPRVRAARARQRRYASTDVREITDADVFESVTLGETDLFRALQRLPSVTAPSFTSAELWTRGSSWDRTRVYFDGAPVFAPFHGAGSFTGFANDVIGRAVLFPGVRPADIGEGASAVLDLRSRVAVPDGDLRGLVELTPTFGRAALTRGSANGSNGWTVVGRHETLDLFDIVGDPTTLTRSKYRKYYDDVAGSWHGRLGPSTTLNVSGLFSSDAYWVDNDYQPRYESASRNSVGTASLTTSLSGMRFVQRATVSAYGSKSLEASVLEPQPVRGDTARWGILHLSLDGRLEAPDRDGTPTPWRTGYDLTWRAAHGAGYYSEWYLDHAVERRLDRDDALPTIGLWGERTLAPRPWLRADAGLRLDIGRAIANAGAVRTMPRLELRASMDPQLQLSLAAGRSYQYTQSAPRGGGAAPWELTSASIPALRTDMLTLGAERWVSSSVLVSMSAYARHQSGLLIQDPGRFPLSTARASLPPTALVTTAHGWQIGTENSQGIEFSARRLAGRVTGAIGYSLARARVATPDDSYPADEDRPWSLDATLLVRATRHLSLGAAYTRMADSPFRAYYRYEGLDSSGHPAFLEIVPDPPNRLRGHPSGTLDLQADWHGSIWRLRSGIFFQLRNAQRLWTRRRYGDGIIADPSVICAPRVPGESCWYSGALVKYRGSSFDDVDPTLGIRIVF